MGPLEFLMFTPLNGALGVTIACTGTTANAALPAVKGDTLAITNLGDNIIFVALGDSSVAATTACMAVPPGTYFVNVPNAGSSGRPTYIAGITGGTSQTLQATLGNAVAG